MGDQLESSRLQVFLEAALEDYEKQTGIALIKHPLAERLYDCDSLESVTAVLAEQLKDSGDFQLKPKLMKSLGNTLSLLHRLPYITNFGQDVGLVRPYGPTRCPMSLILIL